MPEEPIHYTKKELEAFLDEFKVYVDRMRAILQETQELSAHLELQSAKLERYEERVHAGKQAYDTGVLGADTMHKLEQEFDLITDLHYPNGAPRWMNWKMRWRTPSRSYTRSWKRCRATR